MTNYNVCLFVSDGDLITIFDSSDLSFAIQCSRILKLTLFGKFKLLLFLIFHITLFQHYYIQVGNRMDEFCIATLTYSTSRVFQALGRMIEVH